MAVQRFTKANVNNAFNDLTQWQILQNNIDFVGAGYIACLGSLSGTTLTLPAGTSFEVGGNYWFLDAAATYTVANAATTGGFLYASEAGAISVSTSVPVWNGMKRGWYSGNYRALIRVVSGIVTTLQFAMPANYVAPPPNPTMPTTSGTFINYVGGNGGIASKSVSLTYKHAYRILVISMGQKPMVNKQNVYLGGISGIRAEYKIVANFANQTASLIYPWWNIDVSQAFASVAARVNTSDSKAGCAGWIDTSIGLPTQTAGADGFDAAGSSRGDGGGDVNGNGTGGGRSGESGITGENGGSGTYGSGGGGGGGGAGSGVGAGGGGGGGGSGGRTSGGSASAGGAGKKGTGAGGGGAGGTAGESGSSGGGGGAGGAGFGGGAGAGGSGGSSSYSVMGGKGGDGGLAAGCMAIFDLGALA